VSSAADAVASTASDIASTIATDISLLPIIIDQLPDAYQQTLESGAQFDSVLGYFNTYTDMMNPLGGGTGFVPWNPASGGYQVGEGVGTGTAIVSQLVLIGSGVSGAAGSGVSGGTLTVPVIGVVQTSGGLLTTVVGTTEVAINTGALINGGVILVGAADLGLGVLQKTGGPSDGGSPSGDPDPSPTQSPTDVLKPGGQYTGQPGTSSQIRLLEGDVQDATSLFTQLTQGGTVVPSPTYPGTLVHLPGGGYIGLRPVSASGPPTIDVMGVPGLRIREIKFLETLP
jgi:hypothetical protein